MLNKEELKYKIENKKCLFIETIKFEGIIHKELTSCMKIIILNRLLSKIRVSPSHIFQIESPKTKKIKLNSIVEDIVIFRDLKKRALN